MERHFGNYASLRQQIVSSSPELRALESKLQACAVTRDNKAAIAEKGVHEKLRKIGEREYADLVKMMDQEEQLSATLTLADQHAKIQETQRVLKDQINEKEANKAKTEAEKVVELMAEVDESKVLEEEKKEHWMKKQAYQENTRQILQKQAQLRKLLEEENKLEDRNLSRSAEEYNVKIELQKEMEHQKAEMQRLEYQQRELSLVQKLEEQQIKRDMLQETKLELEILEKTAQERKIIEEKEKKREEARLNLLKGLDDQIRYKEEQESKEQEKEAEYGKLLLEVMAEEGRLEQLVARARRQRQLDHRQLVECLLKERRALRAKLMEQRRQEDQEESAYNHLRKSILEEEEKLLLLKHAPHLLPFFTPELRARLRQLI